MADEFELSPDNDPSTAAPPPQTEEELEKIFEERFELFMGQLSTSIEQEQVPVAIAILVDPKYPATPMVYKSGHIYDQARLLANVLRHLRKQMDKELTP